MKIRFGRDGVEIGEYPEQAIPALLQSGVLQRTDFYWHEGMAEWKPIGAQWPIETRKAPLTELQTSPPTSASTVTALTVQPAKRGKMALLVTLLLLAAGGAVWFYLPPSRVSLARNVISGDSLLLLGQITTCYQDLHRVVSDRARAGIPEGAGVDAYTVSLLLQNLNSDDNQTTDYYRKEAEKLTEIQRRLNDAVNILVANNKESKKLVSALGQCNRHAELIVGFTAKWVTKKVTNTEVYQLLQGRDEFLRSYGRLMAEWDSF